MPAEREERPGLAPSQPARAAKAARAFLFSVPPLAARAALAYIEAVREREDAMG